MMYSTSFLNRDPLKNTPSQGEYTDFMDSYILHVSASCFSDPLHHPRLATIPRAEAIAEGVALPPASQRNWQILHLSLTCHWSTAMAPLLFHPSPPLPYLEHGGTVIRWVKGSKLHCMGQNMSKWLSAAHFRKCGAVWLLQAR